MKKKWYGKIFILKNIIIGGTKNGVIRTVWKKIEVELDDNITEGILQFENLNLKLAVIQVLMYDLNLLKPRFDIYGFADEHKELEINTDSYTVIEPALNFFRELSIPREFAQYVEKIDMDGGNEVYMNIIPQWDGEDECFDLNNLTSSEIRQFPNLKKATIMSSNFDKVKEIFDAENIDVELL